MYLCVQNIYLLRKKCIIYLKDLKLENRDKEFNCACYYTINSSCIISINPIFAVHKKVVLVDGETGV